MIRQPPPDPPSRPGAVADGEHLSIRTMEAHLEGGQPATERSEVERHLVSCGACLELFLELEGFQRSDEEAGRDRPDAARDRAWQGLAAELEGERTSGRQHPRQGLGRDTRHPRSDERWRWAIAASLLAVLGLGALSGTLWRENRQLQVQLAELRTVRGPSGFAGSGRDPGVPESPWLNVPVTDLESSRDGKRGEDSGPAVRLRATTRGHVLVLHTLDERDFETYALELLDGEGARLWRGEGLEKQPGGLFLVALPSDLLGEGPRRLRVWGTAPSGDALIEEYDLVAGGA